MVMGKWGAGGVYGLWGGGAPLPCTSATEYPPHTQVILINMLYLARVTVQGCAELSGQGCPFLTQ